MIKLVHAYISSGCFMAIRDELISSGYAFCIQEKGQNYPSFPKLSILRENYPS